MPIVLDAHRSYLAAAGATADVVARIPAHAWARPALGEWDLRALVGHTAHAGLSTVAAHLQQVASREDITCAAAYYALPPTSTGEGTDADVARRGHDAGRELGEDPAAGFHELVDRVAGLLEHLSPSALVQTPAGGIRVDAYLPSRAVELVVHGYDIATAAELTFDVPSGVLAEVVATLVRTGVELGHGPALVHALTGRAPLPEGYRVV